MNLRAAACIGGVGRALVAAARLVTVWVRARPAIRVIAAMLVVATLATGCASLDARLRAAVFRPSRVVPDEFPGLDASDRTYMVRASNPHSDEWLQIWWMPAADPGAPTLLYLHGTFRNLFHNHPKMQAIRAAGFSVLAVEYRGWGRSSPLLPTEASILADAELGWRELVRVQPDPLRRVVYGHSMGSAVAVELAARKAGGGQLAGLVIESSFTSAIELAGATNWLAGPLASLAGWGFDARARIAQVDVPLLSLHGTADEVVPFLLGRELFEAARPPKTMVAFDGGTHSDLHVDDATRYLRTFADFATKIRHAAAQSGSSG